MARAAALFLVVLGACTAPGDAEVALGNRLARESKLGEAADAYRAAAAKSRRARPLELLGLVLHQAGKSDEARAAWLEAAQLEPDSADAQLGLARLESERGDQAAALDRLDRLVQRQPNRADVRVERAVALLRRNLEGDVERALGDTELALRVTPNDVDARYARGTALLAARKIGEAKGVFDRLKPLAPYLATWGLARVAAAEQRNIDVIVHLREAREAADAGWANARVRDDPAFRYLWEDPEFMREF